MGNCAYHIATPAILGMRLGFYIGLANLNSILVIRVGYSLVAHRLNV